MDLAEAQGLLESWWLTLLRALTLPEGQGPEAVDVEEALICISVTSLCLDKDMSLTEAADVLRDRPFELTYGYEAETNAVTLTINFDDGEGLEASQAVDALPGGVVDS